MAGHIQPIYFQALDAVRLDGCGDPLDGPDSYIRLSNAGAIAPLGRLTLTPVYYTPADKTLPSGNGKRVIIKGQPVLEGYTVELTLVGMMPGVHAMLTADRPLEVSNQSTGVVKGARAKPNAFALRVWQSTEPLAACDTSPPWLVHWLARVDRWQSSGSFEVGDSTPAEVFTAYADRNPNFGTGPHDDFATEWYDEEIYAYEERASLAPPAHSAEPVAWPIV